jgi:cytochrome c-type biogenesis protein CcmE
MIRERKRERERITVVNVTLITSIFAINLYVLSSDAYFFLPNFVFVRDAHDNNHGSQTRNVNSITKQSSA